MTEPAIRIDASGAWYNDAATLVHGTALIMNPDYAPPSVPAIGPWGLGPFLIALLGVAGFAARASR